MQNTDNSRHRPFGGQHGRRIAGFAALILVGTGGCAIVQQQALAPIDWIDVQVERYAVTGTGSWARLRKQPLTLGPFTAEVAAQSLWSSLPTTNSSDIQASVGSDDKDGHQLRSGTVTRHSESELQFNLTGPEGSLADVRCRQLLHIENQETGVSRGDGSNTFSMSENVAYNATLNCRSKGVSARWPQWQLDLHSGDPTPMRGTLTVDGSRYDVVGSQASTIGRAPTTVSYEIQRGGHTLAQVDRSGDGLLSVAMPMADKPHLAIVGAAAVLLLADDPLEPQG